VFHCFEVLGEMCGHHLNFVIPCLVEAFSDAQVPPPPQSAGTGIGVGTVWKRDVLGGRMQIETKHASPEA